MTATISIMNKPNQCNMTNNVKYNTYTYTVKTAKKCTVYFNRVKGSYLFFYLSFPTASSSILQQ